MSTNNEVRVNEPRWALAYVRGNRHVLPRFTGRGIPIKESVAKVTQEYKAHDSGPVARDILGGVWDRLSLRQAKEANTLQELRSAYFDAREGSEARAFIGRKIARRCNAEAVAAKTLGKTLDALKQLVSADGRSQRVEHKIGAMFANLCRKAKTMEDFQRIFYYADRSTEIATWAQDNWDHMSKAEVDAARSLTALAKAHRRTDSVHVDGIMSWGGSRRMAAKQYAEAKWDKLALKKAQAATTLKQYKAVLKLSRHESRAEHVVIGKLVALQADFAELKTFYYFLCNHYRHPEKASKQKFIGRFIALCATPEDAAWLYEAFRLSAPSARRLIKRFPTLVARY